MQFSEQIHFARLRQLNKTMWRLFKLLGISQVLKKHLIESFELKCVHIVLSYSPVLLYYTGHSTSLLVQVELPKPQAPCNLNSLSNLTNMKCMNWLE